jgi:3-oxoacyl-(acyl-carrier-protein) synthase
VTVKLLRQIFELGPEQVSPALFTESVGNAPASQVAIAWRMLGPNLAIQQREASGLLALLQAVQLLRRKAAERVLVLEVEEMIPLLHAVLDRFHALAHRTPQDEERPRPFDRRRNGFLAAEGATALVLEPLKAVETRGGSVLALLRGGVAAFDPTAPPWDWGSGAPMLAAKLRHGLERLGIPLGSLEAIVAGGSGSVRGDRLEAEVLRSLFGEALPPLVAPKAVFGEYGGGLLASAVALLQPGTPLPPSEDFEVDPELGIALAKAWSSPGRVLVSSVASGGPAAWIVLERAPGACA